MEGRRWLIKSLILLFYNGISPNGKDKFKPIIEKYAIFKNLREDFLVNEENDLISLLGNEYKLHYMNIH